MTPSPTLRPLPFPLLALSLALSLATAACAGSSAEPRSPADASMGAMPGGNTPPPGPPVQASTNVISSSGEAGTSSELFEKGKKLLLEEKYKEAAEAFDLVMAGDPQGRLGPMALMNAGLAYEGAANRETAAARYQQLVDRYPKDELVKTALLRSGRLFIAAEKWAELGKGAEALLSRGDLTVSESLEATGDKALSLVERGDVEQSSRLAEQARTLMEKHHIGEVGRVPHEVALVFFSLGEVRRVKSEKLVFEPMPDNFGESFEARASGLLDAQSAYTDAMRTSDPFWATWAGYRVGQLYQQLHHDVMVIKLPEKAKTAKDKTLIEGAMQLRYRILLEKGLKMMDATVKMNERLGEQNTWSARARETRSEIERELAETNAIIKKTGVPEGTLKIALDELSKQKK